MTKKWWTSKTIWANALALVASIVMERFGVDVDEQYLVWALAIVNLVLRKVTKEEIAW